MKPRCQPWLLTLLAACAKPAPEPEPAPPEPMVLRAGQSDLLFTYRDPDTGRYETVSTHEEVPGPARAQVVVVDLSVSPEARRADRYVQVADLRAAQEDGTYPVAVASRHRLEAEGRADGPVGAREGVVLYSASWCGVCKKARRALSERQVPFVEKDIEASRSALDELTAKAAAVGMQPSGVPVIDVAGQLLFGLDLGRLDAALSAAALSAADLNRR